jgi:hypothetical protein
MQLTAPALQQLYADWERWRGADKFPSGEHLDPLQLRYMLGNLSVFEVQYNPLRFFVRIHATARAERMGFDLTGKSLDDLPEREYRELIRGHLIEVLKRRGPFSTQVEPAALSKAFGRVEVLILPFARDGQTIDLLLAGTHPLPEARRAPAAAPRRDTA